MVPLLKYDVILFKFWLFLHEIWHTFSLSCMNCK